MLSVYVAAPWVCREDAQHIALVLQGEGFGIASRWHSLHVNDEKDPAILRGEAEHDVEDIIHADVMLVLQFAKSEGKAWEQGYYMAQYDMGMKDHPIIAVCPDGHGSIFQRLPEYVLCMTVEEALGVLKLFRTRGGYTCGDPSQKAC